MFPTLNAAIHNNCKHDTVNDTPEIQLYISLSTLNVTLYWCIAAD